jgi:hypothetical protein
MVSVYLLCGAHIKDTCAVTVIFKTGGDGSKQYIMLMEEEDHNALY